MRFTQKKQNRSSLILFRLHVSRCGFLFFFLALFSCSLCIFRRHVLRSAQLQQTEASGCLIGWGNKCFQSQMQPIVEGQPFLTIHSEGAACGQICPLWKKGEEMRHHKVFSINGIYNYHSKIRRARRALFVILCMLFLPSGFVPWSSLFPMFFWLWSLHIN